MDKSYFSMSIDWVGCLEFGLVSNDAQYWRPVGEEFPIYSVLSSSEKGFETICFDTVIRHFKYYKFDQTKIRDLSDMDKYYLKKVYY